MLPADPGSWKEKPPRLALLRTVAAVPLLASAALAWRQWRDSGRRVRAPWEERAAFSARGLAESASAELSGLPQQKSVPLPLHGDDPPFALLPPLTGEQRHAAREAEAFLREIRESAAPPDATRLLRMAADHQDTVTESGLPFPPLLWHTVAALPPDRALPAGLWARELSAAALDRPSLLSGRLLASAAARLPDPARATENSAAGSDAGPAAVVAGTADEAARRTLEKALAGWADMESLAASLGNPDKTRTLSRNEPPFWTTDGEWLVFPRDSAENAADSSWRILRGLRRGWIITALSKELRAPDSRFSCQLELQGKAIPVLTNSAHSSAAGVSASGGGPGSGSGSGSAPEPEISAEATAGLVSVRVQLQDSAPLRAELSAERRTLLLLPALAALSGLGGWLALERALRRQERLGRLKTDFVSSVSHELRAPVAGIRLLAERMAAGKADAEETASYSRMIEREARRVSALVENVLDFARVENGRKAYQFERCGDPAALLREACETMEPLAAARGIRLETWELPAALPPLRADPAALRQALVNLLDNAVKFSPPGGVVRLSLGLDGTPAKNPEPRALLFRVQDEGPGIPASELPWIFERFFRGGEELRRGTPGAGIGLSLVQHIARIHGGEVLVKTKPCAGSEFTLRLPATEAEPD